MKLILKTVIPVFIFLISVEVILRFYSAVMAPANILHKDGAYSILTLGESTTQRIGDGSDWPNQLEHMLNRNFNAVVYNEGIAATATPTILQKVPDYFTRYRPKLVITMMGINDNSAFWQKKFVLSDENFFTRHFKTYKFLKYIFAELKEQSVKLKPWVEPDIPFSQLDYPDFQNLLNSLQSATYKSRQYNSILEKISTFLKDKTPLQRAQFLVAIGDSVKMPDKNSNIRKKLDFLLEALKYDTRVSDSINLALHYAITTEQLQHCRPLIELARRDRIRMNDTFLIRATACLRNPEETKKLFHEAGDIYEYRPDASEAPTVQNYLAFADYIQSEGVCWIAMEYPNREFSEAIKQVASLNTDNIFPLLNLENFKNALATHRFEDVFSDKFAGQFGHATRFGNSLIAGNVYGLIEKLRTERRCNLN